jgi:hypothetical protein
MAFSPVEVQGYRVSNAHYIRRQVTRHFLDTAMNMGLVRDG